MMGILKTLYIRPNLGHVPYVERNLIDLDDLVDSETTSAGPNDLLSKIKVLKKKVVEEDAKHICLKKEKEVITMNALIEREYFLRRMEELKE